MFVNVGYGGMEHGTLLSQPVYWWTVLEEVFKGVFVRAVLSDEIKEKRHFIFVALQIISLVYLGLFWFSLARRCVSYQANLKL